MADILYTVIPCYNEEKVLPQTAPLFLSKIMSLIKAGKISDESRILFVNDGSKDNTWDIITKLSKSDAHFCGISLSRNRGHQNALFAGLTEAKDKCDVTVSIDCDGQDDINAVDKMIDEYQNGFDIVYGVRDDRKSDGAFKRFTAESFYKFIKSMGVETVYNHADYRLMSKRAVEALCEFKEVNLFLRGAVPLVGFKSTSVYYKRTPRIAGESHYPLKRMLSLASNGIFGFSLKPLRLITVFGAAVSLVGFAGLIWAIVAAITGNAAAGFITLASLICFLGGVQLLSLGIIGEYIGRMYKETQNRPLYIIDKKTYK